MSAIDAALSGSAFTGLQREQAPLREDAEAAVLRAHGREHLERLRALSADRDRRPASIDVANAFCQVRPPGHHAGRDRAMEFCCFSTAAVAALYARALYRVRRIAVVDFDVHHGNGTQEVFWADPDLFYGSTHQMPLFPGTGAASERGAGNIWNAPLRAGDGGEAFRAAFERRILPALERFGPELVLVSAGFDAHWDDPLAGLRLIKPDFAWVTGRILDVARRRCGRRVVSLLEGGYQLDALARSAAAHVGALMRGAE